MAFRNGIADARCAGAARKDHPELQSTQASIAISADGDHWFLINASPDLRQQLIATPQLYPKAGALRHSPITGVILTNGEIDAVAGLLSMRESSPFTIYAHAKVLAILKPIAFSMYSAKRTCVASQSKSIKRSSPVLPDGSLTESKFWPSPFLARVHGIWKARPIREAMTAPVTRSGFVLATRRTERYFYFIAACANVSDELKSRLAGAPLLFFDGTVWRDDELIAAGLGIKTGQGMGHIAMSGEGGAI